MARYDDPLEELRDRVVSCALMYESAQIAAAYGQAGTPSLLEFREALDKNVVILAGMILKAKI